MRSLFLTAVLATALADAQERQIGPDVNHGDSWTATLKHAIEDGYVAYEPGLDNLDAINLSVYGGEGFAHRRILIRLVKAANKHHLNLPGKVRVSWTQDRRAPDEKAVDVKDWLPRRSWKKKTHRIKIICETEVEAARLAEEAIIQLYKPRKTFREDEDE